MNNDKKKLSDRNMWLSLSRYRKTTCLQHFFAFYLMWLYDLGLSLDLLEWIAMLQSVEILGTHMY